MKSCKIVFCFSIALFLICGLSGCLLNQNNSTSSGLSDANFSMTNDTRGVSIDQNSGSERTFTNANATMWVPSRAVHVWDGHTSVVDVDETTFPGAFVKDYKIVVEIQISDTPREFQQMEQWSSSNWYFEDFPELSTRETNYGIQIRKDIWDKERSKRLLINAMVKKSNTFENDIETAKRMVESVKLIVAK